MIVLLGSHCCMTVSQIKTGPTHLVAACEVCCSGHNKHNALHFLHMRVLLPRLCHGCRSVLVCSVHTKAIQLRTSLSCRSRKDTTLLASRALASALTPLSAICKHSIPQLSPQHQLCRRSYYHLYGKLAAILVRSARRYQQRWKVV